jgi:hypothetical protein
MGGSIVGLLFFTEAVNLKILTQYWRDKILDKIFTKSSGHAERKYEVSMKRSNFGVSQFYLDEINF